MDVERIRQICLSFPSATEQIQWEHVLLFKVGGKMFALAALEPGKVWLSFKASPESFAELTERPGIIPAPYLARAQWVGLETQDALRLDELAQLLRESYDLIFSKLPKSKQERLITQKPEKKTKRSSRRTRESKLRRSR
jgi:predicted DNA-binding protein (MmcQ/YjbR family)